IVIGLPRRTDGRLGPEAEAVQAFGRQLEASAGVPVVYWDERFSTAPAEHTLLAAGVRRARRRQVIDQLTASVILQAYLDRRRREAEQREEHAEGRSSITSTSTGITTPTTVTITTTCTT